MVQQKLVSSEKNKNEKKIYQAEPELRFCEFSDKWSKRKLKEVGDIITGTTPSTKEKDNFDNQSFLWVTPGDIHGQKYVIKTERYLTEKGIKNGREIPKNSVLVTCIGATIGKICILPEKGSCNQQLNAIIPNEEFNSDFIYYSIQKNTEKLKLYAGNTATPILNKKTFGNISYNFPNIHEQNKIGKFLSAIDKKIELLEKKYQKVSILKDYYYSTIFNLNTLDTLKTEYEELLLEEIVTKFSTGLNPRKNFKLNDGGSNFYVTIKNFGNGILNLDEKCDKIDDNALNLINKRSDLKKDDLLFASIGRVGEVYLIKEDPVNWNINESVFSLRGDKNKVNPKFLYCLMKSNRVQHYFDIHITGSTFKSIKMKDLRKMPIIIPYDINKQEYLADFLLKFDRKCYLMEKEIEDFKLFKKGLLQKMLI